MYLCIYLLITIIDMSKQITSMACVEIWGQSNARMFHEPPGPGAVISIWEGKATARGEINEVKTGGNRLTFEAVHHFDEVREWSM